MNTFARLTIFAIFLLGSTSASAASYRLDFGGQTNVGTFSGYAILDYSVPDSQSDLDRGFYLDLVSQIEVRVNGIDYSMVAGSGAGNHGATANNLDGIGDFFGFIAIISDSNGPDDYIAIQFQNLLGNVFSSDALPTSLTFTMCATFPIFKLFGMALATQIITVIKVDILTC